MNLLCAPMNAGQERLWTQGWTGSWPCPKLGERLESRFLYTRLLTLLPVSLHQLKSSDDHLMHSAAEGSGPKH